MKKGIAFCISFITISTQLALAQGTLVYNWIKENINAGTNGAEAWGVDVSNGFIYWPVTEDSATTNLNIKCYKLNLSGNTVWNQPFYITDAGNEKAFIVKATDSVIYIGGHHCPPLGFGVDCPQLLLKVNTQTGAFIDSFAYKYNNAFGYNEVDDIEIRNDGIYLSGWAQTAGGSFQTEIGLMKISHDLNAVLWSTAFGQPNTGEHQDGHFVTDNNYIFASGMWGGTGIANLYEGKPFLGKFSITNGTLIDSVLFGNTGSWLNLEDALGMTTDGNKLFLTGVTTVATNDNQIFVACYDKSLNNLWTHYWGGSATETARAIEVNNGYVYVGGQSNSTNISTSGYDGVVLMYDTAGNFITYRTFSTPGNDEIRDLKIDSSNIYFSGARSQNLATSGTDVAFLIQTPLSSVTSINEIDFGNSFSVYPNPANSELVVNCQEKINEIKVFDIIGKEMYSSHASTSNVKLQISNFNPGIYFIQLKSDKGSAVKRFVISK